jgi:2-methylisocitrate lyase-like PEP mutase family enzyme
MQQRTRLREILSRPELTLVPGTYDCLSARLVEQAGFEVVSVSGAAVTASILGLPDLGLLGMSELLGQVRQILRSVNIPVTVDCEGGYGGVFNVARTVQEFEAAGVASLCIEDQVVAAKRCGHFRDKQIVPREEMVAKLRAAVGARTDPALMLMARTDARAVYGLDDALDRARAYAAAGADILFVEAPEDRAEVERIGRELAPLGLPIKINLVEGGKTPLMSHQELAALGFRILNFSGSLQRAGMKAMQELLAELRRTGNVDAFYPGRVASLDERSAVLGLDRYYDLEQALLAESTALAAGGGQPTTP